MRMARRSLKLNIRMEKRFLPKGGTKMVQFMT